MIQIACILTCILVDSGPDFIPELLYTRRVEYSNSFGLIDDVGFLLLQ